MAPAFGTLHHVHDARNGSDALRLLDDLSGRKIDLVVTDVVMPHLGGQELIRQLRALDPDVRVLYTTGYTDSSAIRSGQLEPGIALLQKPFSPDALARKVRELLDN